MQTFRFIAGLVQILRILQQQPSGSFEDLLGPSFRGLPVPLPTPVGHVVVEPLENVEVIEDEDGLAPIRLDRVAIGRRPVHRHGLDLGRAAFQAFPEGFESIGPFALSHKHDRPGFQVQDHRPVSIPPADGDFIDRDPTQVLELDAAEPAAQGAFLNAFDQVPTHLEMLGHIADGPAVGQLQNVAFDGVGVGASLVGKPHRHLANLAAVGTADPRHRQLDLNRSGAEGKTSKATRLKSPPDDTPGPASRTAKIPPFRTEGERHLAALIPGLHRAIAPNPKPRIP